MQSCLTDAAITNPELRSLSLSNHLLLAAQGAWLQRLQGQSLTSFHKDVHEALKQAGAKCRLNVALGGWQCMDATLALLLHVKGGSLVDMNLAHAPVPCTSCTQCSMLLPYSYSVKPTRAVLICNSLLTGPPAWSNLAVPVRMNRHLRCAAGTHVSRRWPPGCQPGSPKSTFQA